MCFYAVSAYFPPNFKWNADASTAIVKESNNGALICYIHTKDEKKKLDSCRVSSDLSILVKWEFLGNTYGATGPMVLLIPVPDIKYFEFFVQSVTHLAAYTDESAIGYLGIPLYGKTGLCAL